MQRITYWALDVFILLAFHSIEFMDYILYKSVPYQKKHGIMAFRDFILPLG